MKKAEGRFRRLRFLFPDASQGRAGCPDSPGNQEPITHPANAVAIIRAVVSDSEGYIPRGRETMQDQTLNELPQPQDFTAFGFSKLKPERSIPSW